MTINHDDYFDWHKQVYMAIADTHQRLHKNERPTLASLRDLFDMACSEYWLDQNHDLSGLLPPDERVPRHIRQSGIESAMAHLIDDWTKVFKGRYSNEATDIMTAIYLDKESCIRTRMLAEYNFPALRIWQTSRGAFAREQIGEAMINTALDASEHLFIRICAFEKITKLITERMLEPSELYRDASYALKDHPAFSGAAYRLMIYYHEKAPLLTAEPSYQNLIDKVKVAPH